MNETRFPALPEPGDEQLIGKKRRLNLFRARNAARRRRRFRSVSVRFIIPNLVTLLALCMGLTGIRFAIESNFYIAVLAVIAAAVLDGLDGRLARALRGTSRFGAELDSLADFVDFGVAPALILYLWCLQDIKSPGWFAALIFASACALRLARFNVSVEDQDRPPWHVHFFTGMPAPAGAIVVLLPLYLHLSVFSFPRSPALAPVEIAYVLIVALLMASRIPHFSGKKIGKIPREYIIIVLLSIVIVILLTVTYPMEMLAGLSFLYLGSIPFSVRRFRSFEQKDDLRPNYGKDAEFD